VYVPQYVCVWRRVRKNENELAALKEDVKLMCVCVCINICIKEELKLKVEGRKPSRLLHTHKREPGFLRHKQ
jgi:hypothetical protein